MFIQIVEEISFDYESSYGALKQFKKIIVYTDYLKKAITVFQFINK